jgi:hypothetical protein
LGKNDTSISTRRRVYGVLNGRCVVSLSIPDRAMKYHIAFRGDRARRGGR